MMMKIKELYEQGVKTLLEIGIEEARTDITILMEELCAIKKSDLYVHGDDAILPDKEKLFIEALEKRKKHIPVSQIIGKWEFMGLEFFVNEHVLTPRQDTEILVEEVMKEMQDGYRILDMCTGSGCILLSLLHYSNHCEGTGVDISPKALEVAKRNGEKLLENPNWIQSNLFENVDGKYDIIVSNPPYIQSDVIGQLMEEVKDHEPLIALDGKEDGLFFYRKIINEAPDYLCGGGQIYFEIGYDQGKAVSDLLTLAGFTHVEVIKDYAGLDRVVKGSCFGGNKNV